jgi:hypothetical protein
MTSSRSHFITHFITSSPFLVTSTRHFFTFVTPSLLIHRPFLSIFQLFPARESLHQFRFDRTIPLL